MSNGWTAERRLRQPETIKQWKPWQKSTGPSTEAEKSISSKNAIKYNAIASAKAITAALKNSYVFSTI